MKFLISLRRGGLGRNQPRRQSLQSLLRSIDPSRTFLLLLAQRSLSLSVLISQSVFTRHTKSFRREVHQHLSRLPSNWCGTVTMSTSASSKRQVLAKFIDEVPPNKGWWFRLPTISSSQLPHPTDCCMPHLGVPFGMTEVAMVNRC